MTQPTTPPVNPPTPPDFVNTPAGNFLNPAFLLSLVPTVSFVLTLFFHRDFGLGANSAQWAMIGSALVAAAAYIARAVKHHAYGKVLEAWLAFLASQTGQQVTTQTNNGQTSVVTTVPVTTNPTPEPVTSPQSVDTPVDNPPGDEGGGSLEGRLKPENVPTRAISTTRSAQQRTPGKKTSSARGR